MEYRQLGSNGPQVPVLGLGTWPLGGGMGPVDEKVAIATIRAAIDNGITLIDTAEAYLSSEETLGKALGNGYRERCFLATKVSRDYSPQGIREAMERSLRALNVDYVDLYQIHSWNPAYPIDESMETMAELQRAGKTRYIGVSNFTAAQMVMALRLARYEANQVSYSLFDRQIEDDVLPKCRQAEIGILAHSALAKGLLTGRYRSDTVFAANDERSQKVNFQAQKRTQFLVRAEQLQEIAAAKGLSLVQLAIAWTLRQPAVTNVLVGAKNVDQVNDHLGAVGIHFDADELAKIDKVLEGTPDYSPV